MKNNIKSISFITALVLFTGCGGGGGGGGYTPVAQNTKTISGTVIDPEIIDASVKLVCGSSTYTAQTQTNLNGEFSIKVPSSKNLEECTIESTGGFDGGDDLSGLTLKTPYALYNTNSEIFITPFTTILALHDDVNSDMQRAKSEVATFLQISEEELKQNPVNSIDLLRKSKKITKLAITEKLDGSKVGFLDLDGDNNGNLGTSEANFDDYYANDFKNDLNISQEEKDKRDDEFSSIDISNNSNDIVRNTLIEHSFYAIKTAYKLSSLTANEKANIKYLAEKIYTSNQASTSKDKRVSMFQLKKAFLDVDMIPTFSDDAQTVLDTNISTLLNQSESYFKTYIDAKTIEIKDIQNLVIYDVSSTKKSLNNNDERIEYYAFSNVSNLAKAIQITNNTFNDAVNDPVNSYVSVGLANFGLEDEALENIKDNVYTRSGKIEAYDEVGKALQALNYDESAVKAFYESYENLNLEIASIGKENVSAAQLGDLQSLARKIAISGDEVKSNEIIDEIKSFSSALTSSKAYLRITQALKDLSQTVYVQGDDLALAKEYSLKAVEASMASPGDLTISDVFGVSSAIYTAAILGEYTHASNVLTYTGQYDNSNIYFGSSTGLYQKYYPTIVGLSSSYQDALNAYNALATNKKDDALKEGFPAVMMLNNDADDLFTNQLVPSIMTFGIDDVFKYLLPKYETTRFSSAQILLIRNETAKLEDLLDRSRALILSSIWSSASDADLALAYGSWEIENQTKQGSFVQIASWYKQLGLDVKAKITLDEAIAGLSNIASLNQKISGFTNFLIGLTDTGLIDLLNKSEISNILTQLEIASKDVSTSDIQDIVKAANWMSYFDEKVKAEELITKAYNLVSSQSLGTLATVQERVKELVGFYSTSSSKLRLFEDSIAGAYLQVGDKNQAILTIQEALVDANSLGDSTDKYALLVDIATAYASLNDVNNAMNIIADIKTSQEIDLAKVEASKALANFDSFVNAQEASIDSDGDGKPDFWNKNATQSQIDNSLLTLDDDIDNDGNNEPNDDLPYDGVL